MKHGTGRPILEDGRSCYACGTTKSLDTYGWKQWTTNKPTNLFLCKKCNDHLIVIPNRDKEVKRKENAIYNKFKIRFLGKRIFLGWDPRKGQCEECMRKVGAPYITSRGKHARLKVTQMHHYFYIPCMPWACMVERCTPCHNKTKTRTRKKVSAYYFDKNLRKRNKDISTNTAEML